MSNDTGNTMQNQGSKLDEATRKYAAKYDAFAQSSSGNAILAFLRFEKNIMPYTLEILFLLSVAVIWIIGIIGIFGAGPFEGMPFTWRLPLGVGCVVAGPFVLHYLFEIGKYAFFAIGVPLWDKLVIRYLVNLVPELFPFMLERFMKFIDIVLDGTVVIIMAVAGVLKGMLWLPTTLGQRLAKWCSAADR